MREEDATEASRFEDSWRYLDWAKSARETHLQVRSWWGTRDALRGAIGTIDGVPTRVLKTRLTDEPGIGAAPGTVLRRDGEALTIQCGDPAPPARAGRVSGAPVAATARCAS